MKFGIKSIFHVRLVTLVFAVWMMHLSRANDSTEEVQIPKTLRLIAQVKDFNVGVLAFSPDGKLLANGRPGKIEIWSTRTWKLMRTLQDPKIQPQFAFSSDDKIITVCTSDYRVQVWDVATAKPLKTFAGLRTYVAFSVDGSLMAGWSAKNGQAEEGAKIWNARTGRRIQSFDYRKTDSDQCIFSRDNKVLLIASVDNFIKIYDVRTGKLINDKDAFGDIKPPIVLSPDGRYFATLAVGKVIGDDPMPDGTARPATDGGLPVSYSAKIWDAHSGKLIREFGYWENWQDSTAPLGFTADSKAIIYRTGNFSRDAGNNQKWVSVPIIIFDVATGKEIRTLDIINPILLSPNGKPLFSGKKDLKVWAMP